MLSVCKTRKGCASVLVDPSRGCGKEIRNGSARSRVNKPDKIPWKDSDIDLGNTSERSSRLGEIEIETN